MTARQRGWLLPAAAACFGPGLLLGRAAGSPWYGAAALVSAFAAFLLLRGKGRFCAALALFLALGCLRGYSAWHPPMPDEGSRAVSGIVSEEIQERSGRQFRTALSGVTLDGLPLPGGAWWSFYADELPEGLLPGMRVTFHGSVYHPSGASNPDGYDFREDLLRRGIRVGIYGNTDLAVSQPDSFSFPGFVSSLRHRLHGALISALGEETGLYASAMLLGTRSFLSREDRTAFSRLGIAHILSVSGFHTGILVGMLALLFRLLRVPQRIRFWLYAAALGFYSALCGGNPPVLRASVLLLLFLRGRMLNRPRSMLHLLSAAFLLFLFVSPVQLTGLSFQLSYGAMLGLAVVSPFLNSLWAPRRRTGRWLRNAFSAYAGTQTGVLLPQLYAFQEIPLLGLIVNGPVLLLGTGLILLYWIVLLSLPFPWLSSAAGFLARSATSAFVSAVRFLGGLPGITLWTKASGPVTAAGILLLALGLCSVFRWKKRSRVLLSSFGTLLIILSLIAYPHRSTEYIQLSAGNADAAVLWDRDTVLVVDAGDDGGDLSDFLRRRRLTPDAVILTHLHADHVFGLKAMVEDRIPIPVICLPDGAEQADVHPDVLQFMEELKESGTEFRTLSSGDVLSLPSGEITAVWPKRGKTRPGQDANESCLVLRIHLLGTVLLQTGDLDGRYEKYAAVPADLLKIAHHGSVSSTSPAFLEAVHPRAVLLSCGSENRYAQVNGRLGGIPLFSTDPHGMLTVHFRDHAFSVETFLSEPEVVFPEPD